MIKNFKFLFKKFCYENDLKVTNKIFENILSNNPIDYTLKNINLEKLVDKDKVLAHFYLSTKKDKINDNLVFDNYLDSLFKNFDIFLNDIDDFITSLVILNNFKVNYNIIIPIEHQKKIIESIEYFTFDIEADKIIEIGTLISNIIDNNNHPIKRLLTKTKSIISNGNILNLLLLMAKNNIYNEDIIMDLKTRFIDDYKDKKDFEKYQITNYIYMIMYEYEDIDLFEFLIDNIDYSQLSYSDNITLLNIYLDKSRKNAILIKNLLENIYTKINKIEKNQFVDLWLAISIINKKGTNINWSNYITKLLNIKKYNWSLKDLDDDELIAVFASVCNLKYKNKEFTFIIINRLNEKLKFLEKHQLILLLKSSYTYSNLFSFFFINIHDELEKQIEKLSKKEFDLIRSIIKLRSDIVLDSVFLKIN